MVMRVFVAGGTGVVGGAHPWWARQPGQADSQDGTAGNLWRHLPCRGGDRLPVNCCCSLGRLTGGADPLPGREAAVGVASGW